MYIATVPYDTAQQLSAILHGIRANIMYLNDVQAFADDSTGTLFLIADQSSHLQSMYRQFGGAFRLPRPSLNIKEMHDYVYVLHPSASVESVLPLLSTGASITQLGHYTVLNADNENVFTNNHLIPRTVEQFFMDNTEELMEPWYNSPDTKIVAQLHLRMIKVWNLIKRSTSEKERNTFKSDLDYMAQEIVAITARAEGDSMAANLKYKRHQLSKIMNIPESRLATQEELSQYLSLQSKDAYKVDSYWSNVRRALEIRNLLVDGDNMLDILVHSIWNHLNSDSPAVQHLTKSETIDAALRAQAPAFASRYGIPDEEWESAERLGEYLENVSPEFYTSVFNQAYNDQLVSIDTKSKPRNPQHLGAVLFRELGNVAQIKHL